LTNSYVRANPHAKIDDGTRSPNEVTSSVDVLAAKMHNNLAVQQEISAMRDRELNTLRKLNSDALVSRVDELSSEVRRLKK